MLLLGAAAMLASWLMHRFQKTAAGYGLIPLALGIGLVSMLTMHWVNAAFINYAGTYGSAIIVDRQDANFMLNDMPVSHYETLLTTAGGKEILTSFTEMSAAIYPLRNAILIPPMNQRFVVKSIPGHERNFVIMADESDYGKRILLNEAREPVDRARRLFEASPNNADFIQAYRTALEKFLAEQASHAPPDVIERHARELEKLYDGHLSDMQSLQHGSIRIEVPETAQRAQGTMSMMSFFSRLLGCEKTPAATPAKSTDPLLINAYATVRQLPAPDFSHQLHNSRDDSDPELGGHLEGFTNYVMSRGDGQMTAIRYHLWRHIQRVKHQISFSVPEDELGAVERWAYAANAILFLPDGSVRAPDMGTLISADDLSDEHPALPYPVDATKRRERSLDLLKSLRPAPPASMPPALGEAEVVVQPVDAVIRRALALFAVAAHAEAIADGEHGFADVMRERNPTGVAALTEKERAFFDSPEPSADEASIMTWRYEALATLLWALSLAESEPAQAEAPADAQALSRIVMKLAEDDAFRNSVRLRPTAEILDALDLTWRQHWIIRQARQNGEDEQGLSADIIMERHHALNWLTGFHNHPGTDWDDIETPT